MITQDNFKQVLKILGFIHEANTQHEIYTKTIKHSTQTHIMQVDFTHERLIYPQGVTIHDETTSNFAHPENFVVFECVNRLLEKGYKPQFIHIEPKWSLGRGQKGGKADILVKDQENNPYLLIECKTTDSKNSEFSKEWSKMRSDGGQLFSYLQQEKATKFLCLYTSDVEKNDRESRHTESNTESKLESQSESAESKTKSHPTESNAQSTIKYQNYIIPVFDNEEYLQEKELDHSYAKANNATELFSVWKESYELLYFKQGIFEEQVNAYKILEITPTFTNLKELKEEGKYHEFAKILRKHNISGKENAFDKLVNIFLCKIYDETYNKNNLKFGYFGVMADTYASMQDRLMWLYKEAMKEFLGEEITFIDNDKVEEAFQNLPYQDLKATMQDYIKQLKFYSNNDFAFLEVHNKELFLQNALVLKEIIKLFSPYKLTQNSTNQFLGNLFELFLQKGMKQDEGQFFTPIQICEFILYALPLDSLLKSASKPLRVLDFACGAGHFLNTYANELKRYVKKQDLQEHYKNIYGIEKEYRLSKVSKVSSAMYGQNEINILYADALAAHELANPHSTEEQKQKPQIDNYSFDLLIANPPYSVKGFLETLSDKSKNTYTLCNDEINAHTNNAIECFFIERANQLLKDNALAAIILPSSILNKDGIYKSTRKILLANFYIIAIVELGSGTFGATGTNTIILFLRKKQHYPINQHTSKAFSDMKSYIESSNLAEPYEYCLQAYCDFRGFEIEPYTRFLQGKLESTLKDTNAFKDYHSAFIQSSEYKKLKDSKAYKDSSSKAQLEQSTFLSYAQNREKEKLLYFSLSLNQQVLIIKSPSDNKEQKKFLGYEWSNRKGDEGLKELHTPYFSPLFERDNPHNEAKLNALIRQAFLEISSPIPQDLRPYAFRARLIDMLDFDKVDFNKAINLNPATLSEQGGTNPFANCKYELVKLGEVILENQKSKIQVREAKENTMGAYPFYTSGTNIYRYDEALISGENIYLSTGGNAIVQFYNGESAYSTDTYSIKADFKKMLTKFLFYILQILQEHINLFLFKGTGLKHLQKPEFKNLKIPLPPLEIQQQIVRECEKVEEQHSLITQSIEAYHNLIKAILVKCKISDTEGKSDFTFILDTLERLESKLLTPTLQDENADDLTSLLDTLPTPPSIGWEMVKISHIADKLSAGGDKPKAFSESKTQEYQTPIYANAVEKQGLYGYTDKPAITQNALTISARGTIGYAVARYEPFYPIVRLIVLVPKRDKANLKFLEVVVNNSNISGSGVNIPQLTVPEFSNLKIPLPPLEAQEKIISVIEHIESKIASIDSNLANLEARKAEILANALNANNEREREREREQAELKLILSKIATLTQERTRLAHLITLALQKAGLSQNLQALLHSLPTPPSTGWEMVKISHIAQISRGASPRPINDFLTTDSSGVNWIKIGDVAEDAKYITKTEQKITQEGAEKSKRVKVGDFILSNSMSAGRPYILKIDGCIHDGWLLLSHISDKLSKEFLYYALLSDETQRQFDQRARGSVVKNLNTNLVASVKIPLPPLESQEQIIRAIEAVEVKIDQAKAQAQHIESSKDAILHKALMG